MSSFHDRQKSLFNHLKEAEDQCSFTKTNKVTNDQDYGTIDRQTYRRLRREMKQFRGKESIYKKGQANIRECLRAKTIPDFVKNPQKWVYYSLADVTPDQLSDSTNTATALAFLRELEEKEAENFKTDEDSEDAVFKKPTFNFSSASKKKADDQKPVFKCGKVIMPEYVVGVSKKVDKKITNKGPPKETTGATVELKLDHLYEEED